MYSKSFRTFVLFSLVIGLIFTSCGVDSSSSNGENSNNSFNETTRLACETLGGFRSYDDAVRKVRSSDFKFTDAIRTPGSSFVRSAEYYSCNGSRGYFIIYLNNGDYIYENMPISVWNSFKGASSHGSFYSSRIKGNYSLKLN
jgi:hypothetical protein